MHNRICQYVDYVYGLMTGLFAWISLTALSRDYIYGLMTGLFAWISLTVLSRDYVYGLMTGLFAWISLTALSLTYFIDMMCTYCQHGVLLLYMYLLFSFVATYI